MYSIVFCTAGEKIKKNNVVLKDNCPFSNGDLFDAPLWGLRGNYQQAGDGKSIEISWDCWQELELGRVKYSSCIGAREKSKLAVCNKKGKKFPCVAGKASHIL